MKDIHSLIVKFSQYSRMASYRESAHSINNILTSAKIHVTMMKRALEKDNPRAAMERIQKIDNSLDKLVKFSNDISGIVSLTLQPEICDIPTLLDETAELARQILPDFHSRIDYDLTGNLKEVRVDPVLIRILLISFFATGRRMYHECDFEIHAGISADGLSLEIHGSATGQESELGAAEKIIVSRTSGPGFAEIPLLTLKRVVQSQFRDIEFTIPAAEKHEFRLKMKINE